MEGRFRVDEDLCTCCGLCGVVASDHFEPGDRGYRVYRQPRDAAEVRRCQEALEGCPVEAISDQGGSDDGGTTTV